MFGGEEKDEVEGEALDGGDDNDGEEDDDEDGDEDEEEDERKRKKVKMSSGASKKASERKKAAAISPPVVASSSNPLMQSADVAAAPAEKRKRGRPRKIVPPPPVNTLPSLPVHQEPEAMVQDEPAIDEQIRQQWMHPQPQQIQGGQQPQPQQYLLAVFALFSFFNSPLTPSSSSSFFGSSAHANAHTHTGTVLSAQPPLAYAPEIIAQFTPPTNATQLMVNGWSWQEYVQLFHLFVSVLVLVGFVASWMGLDLGRLYSHSHSQAQQQHTKRGRSMSMPAFRASAAEKDKVKTTRRLSGPKGWIKLGEESVFEGRASALSLYDRVQIYRACTSTTTTSAASSSSSSISTLTTLSLILHTTPGPSALLSGLAKMKAQSVWEQAKSAACNPSHSHSLSPSKVPSKALSVVYSLMFEEVKSVESALEMLSRARLERTSEEEEEEEKEDSAPLNVLARLIVKDRVKRHLGKYSSAPSPFPPLLSKTVLFRTRNKIHKARKAPRRREMQSR
ncbi:hypothetical protein CPB84DRAFT_362576 [Gymnopilus junonius]|uniref:Transmembrane protein n=1 Tax=Gymnopilus junonius TaxID=109634 RepID=A0A9P5NWB4_GYMJU|nr:hypothetical protein CPB84DRAFT_362576 [Gymnopilus junonius]